MRLGLKIPDTAYLFVLRKEPGESAAWTCDPLVAGGTFELVFEIGTALRDLRLNKRTLSVDVGVGKG